VKQRGAPEEVRLSVSITFINLNCGCFENSGFAGAETAVFKQSKV
jgi:hypothetical protein